MNDTTEFLVILTVAMPSGAGWSQQTVARTLPAGPEMTRADLYLAARQLLPTEMRDGNTIFFLAEPNRLTAVPEAREVRS